MRARRRGLIVIGALALVAGVVVFAGYRWLHVSPIASSTDDAVAAYSAVLNGRSDPEERALRRLAGAVDQHPDDARAHLWFGLANLHRFIETRELPYAIRTTRALDRAVELDPSDRSAEGWRAFFAYQAARSRAEDLEAPRRALLAAAEADPRFTPFLATVALASMPLETGVPRRLLGPLEAIEDCGDGTSHTCRTGPLFPHGAEGYHATLGDLRVRLGDLEGGRAAYARALEMPAADRWHYRDAFTRWVDDAPARAARLARDDVGDTPIFFMTGERACAGCHRRR